MRKVGDSPPNHQKNEQTPILRGAGLYLGVAFELPGTIIAGIAVGYFVDKYFGTSPWFLLACTAAAFAGAFVRLVSWVRFFTRKRDGSHSEEDHMAD